MGGGSGGSGEKIRAPSLFLRFFEEFSALKDEDVNGLGEERKPIGNVFQFRKRVTQQVFETINYVICVTLPCFNIWTSCKKVT